MVKAVMPMTCDEHVTSEMSLPIAVRAKCLKKHLKELDWAVLEGKPT
jgi:hypothetical protein